MNIINSNQFSFNEYITIVDKYVRADVREINFQNRVVLQLLDKVFLNESEITVIDISTQYKNKEVEGYHTRAYYAWVHTPDLLIAKNWNYANVNMDKDDFLAVVEIKSPILDPISKNKQHTWDEVNEYMKKGSKVILTDCYRWYFFEKGKDLEIFVLHDGNDWVMKLVENSDYIVKEMGFPTDRIELKEWNDLLEYLEDFVILQ